MKTDASMFLFMVAPHRPVSAVFCRGLVWLPMRWGPREMRGD